MQSRNKREGWFRDRRVYWGYKKFKRTRKHLKYMKMLYNAYNLAK